MITSTVLVGDEPFARQKRAHKLYFENMAYNMACSMAYSFISYTYTKSL